MPLGVWGGRLGTCTWIWRSAGAPGLSGWEVGTCRALALAPSPGLALCCLGAIAGVGAAARGGFWLDEELPVSLI